MRTEVVSYLGSLVQSCCGEGGTLQTNLSSMCGEHSQCSSHTGFAPAHVMSAFPVYTAQAPGCSIGSGPWVECTSQAQATQIQVFSYSTKAQTRFGLHFVPFPSEQLRQPGAWRVHSPRVQCASVRFIPSVIPASVFRRAGWVRFVSLLESWFLAATLPVDVNHPESQEIFG